MGQGDADLRGAISENNKDFIGVVIQYRVSRASK